MPLNEETINHAFVEALLRRALQKRMGIIVKRAVERSMKTCDGELANPAGGHSSVTVVSRDGLTREEDDDTSW